MINNLLKRRSFHVFCGIFLVFVILICTIFLPVSKASAAEYMAQTASERITSASSAYAYFTANPNQTTEVLVSLDSLESANLASLLPSDCEIVSLFHEFTYGGTSVYGGYRNCAQKTLPQIQRTYFDEIYGLVEATIVDLEKRISDYNEQLLLDYGGAASIDSVANQDVEMFELKEKLDFYKAQKQSMDSNSFILTGIRIIAENNSLVEMLSSSEIIAIEILNFDNNDLITPIIN